jgi:hypothetical protein
MEEKEEDDDCPDDPVSELLCNARMAEIKSTIRAYITSVGVGLAVLQIVLTVIKR